MPGSKLNVNLNLPKSEANCESSGQGSGERAAPSLPETPPGLTPPGMDLRLLLPQSSSSENEFSSNSNTPSPSSSEKQSFSSLRGFFEERSVRRTSSMREEPNTLVSTMRTASSPPAVDGVSGQTAITPRVFAAHKPSLDLKRAKGFFLNSKKTGKGKDSEDPPGESVYPLGYQGFLEKHSQQQEFNETLRNALSINSFAEPASIALFLKEMQALAIKCRILISETSFLRISSDVKAISKQKLRMALLHYDRTMSFLLAGNEEGFLKYSHLMKSFFWDPKINFGKMMIVIPSPDFFNFVFVASFQNAQAAFKKLKKAFDQYETVFKLNFYSRQTKIKDEKMARSLFHEITLLEKEKEDGLKQLEKLRMKKLQAESQMDNAQANQIGINIKAISKRIHQDIDCDLKKLAEKRRKSSQKLKVEEEKNKRKDFSLIPEFKLFNLNKDCFKILCQLSQEELMEYQLQEKVANVDLPSLRNLNISVSDFLLVCEYFLRVLRGLHPLFYPGIRKEEKNLYCNQDFVGGINALGHTVAFRLFMQEGHRNYQNELLKMLLFKVLDYIGEEKNTALNKKFIFESACSEIDLAFGTQYSVLYHPGLNKFFKKAMQTALREINASDLEAMPSEVASSSSYQR